MEVLKEHFIKYLPIVAERQAAPIQSGSDSHPLSVVRINSFYFNPKKNFSINIYLSLRRGRDSNPRYGFPHTRFPSVRLKPLGHLSVYFRLRQNPILQQVILTNCLAGLPNYKYFQTLELAHA